jgi:hypothetical protein
MHGTTIKSSDPESYEDLRNIYIPVDQISVVCCRDTAQCPPDAMKGSPY